ncbi:MAG: KTSC domain-containing protein [Leadbetterella sp.]|nr:KTSC domain-containing protein [Leadbetterella sp.]
MKKLSLIVFILLSLNAVGQTGCTGLTTAFKSYDQAVSTVRNFGFSFKDRANTAKSSWIRGASYYSCDKRSGFLLISTDNETYIHANVPISMWYQFKSANSFGSYYSSNIRGRFQLRLAR